LLGYATPENIVTVPRDVAFQLGELVELKTVHYSTWAKNRSGEIYTWGASTGLENDPGPKNQPSARRLQFAFPVRSLELGPTGAANFAIDTDGGVWVWGIRAAPPRHLVFNADAGQSLLDAQPLRTSCPPDVVQLCQGDAHACVRTVEGKVWCWGDNTYGQLGDRTFQSRGKPKAVPDLVASHLSCGEDFNCAATLEGVKCWGQNSFSRLGNSVPEKTATPLFISTARP
jgi:alpha-tubulin suppressor-like RCC1 family protein